MMDSRQDYRCKEAVATEVQKPVTGSAMRNQTDWLCTFRLRRTKRVGDGGCQTKILIAHFTGLGACTVPQLPHPQLTGSQTHFLINFHRACMGLRFDDAIAKPL
jgi:hypothetical protein